MAIQNLRRNIQGSAQAAVGGTTATVVLSDWSAADGWIATVELNILAIGVSTEKCNAYYRREVFKWTDGGGAPAGSATPLVAATQIEEDSSWDAHVVLNGNNVEVHGVGDAAEKVNFVWSGTITLQKVT